MLISNRINDLFRRNTETRHDANLDQYSYPTCLKTCLELGEALALEDTIRVPIEEAVLVGELADGRPAVDEILAALICLAEVVKVQLAVEADLAAGAKLCARPPLVEGLAVHDGSRLRIAAVVVTMLVNEKKKTRFSPCRLMRR